MESGQATAADTAMADSAVDTYRRLSTGEVLADLTNLGVDELLLVEQLEFAGEARSEILDRIDQLLTGFDGRPHPADSLSAPPESGEVDGSDEYDDLVGLDEQHDDYDDAPAVPSGVRLPAVEAEVHEPEPAPPAPQTVEAEVHEPEPAPPAVEAEVREPEPAPPAVEAEVHEPEPAPPAPPAPPALEVRQARRRPPAAPPVSPPPPAPPVVAAHAPGGPKKMVSESLLDQMGTLLERDALRRPEPAPIPTSEPGPVDFVPGPVDFVPQPADEPVPGVISTRRSGRRHVGRSVKALGGLAIVAAVGVAAFTFLGPKSGSTGAAAPAPVTTTTVPLAERLLSAVPGYVLQPDAVGDTGLSNLAKAVRDDGKPDAQQALTRDGFVRGYQRLWSNTPQRQVILFVYQFRNGAGAQAYATRMIDVNRADAAALNGTVADLLVPSVPGAVGLSTTSTSGASAGVVFTRDSYVVEVVVHLPATADEGALVQQLAAQQYGLL